MVRLRVLFGAMLGTGLMGLGIGYEMGQRSRPVAKDATVLAPVCSIENGPVRFGYCEPPPCSSRGKTIRVSTFKVEYAPEFLAGRIDLELTEAVMAAIEQKTPYKVVTSDDADMELTGIIKAFLQKVPPDYMAAGSDIRRTETHLVVQLAWKDLRTGKSLLVQKDGSRPDSVELRSVAYYAPELGESITQPRQENVEQMANQIVSLMETSW